LPLGGILLALGYNSAMSEGPQRNSLRLKLALRMIAVVSIALAVVMDITQSGTVGIACVVLATLLGLAFAGELSWHLIHRYRTRETSD
jgi:xanthine/uracil permease